MDRGSVMPARLSVVIPAFNSAHVLPGVIRSVRQACEPEVEIIVVDDGSADETAAVAAATGARVIQQTNQRQAMARKRGLAEVRTPFVAFLDHDDYYRPGRISPLLDLLEAHPEVVVAYGDADSGNDHLGFFSTMAYITKGCPAFHNLPGMPHGPAKIMDQQPFRQLLLQRNLMFQGAAILRTDALRSTPNFDSRAGGADDWLVGMYLSELGPFAFWPESVAIYTRHDRNITNDFEYMVWSFAQARRCYLESSTNLTAQERTLLEQDWIQESIYYAELAYGRGDYREARKRFRGLLRQVPDRRRAWLGAMLAHLPAPIIDQLRRWKSRKLVSAER